MYTDLETILKDNIEKITKLLQEKAKKQFDEETLNYRKKTDLIKLEEKKEKINKQKQELEQKINELDEELYKTENKITNLQTYIDEKFLDENIKNIYKKINNTSYVNRLSEFEKEALEKLENENSIKNLLLFKDIAEDTLNIFKLAVDDKERRNIILTFQSKNWEELWINLPTKAYYKNFDIQNWWIIISWLLENSKNIS